jgi:ribokinase
VLVAKVIVTGSINMDIVVSTPRLPQPGETVSGSELGFFPGGKGANQSVAAARVGAETVFVGGVGDDRFAPELTSFLAGSGVDTSGVRVIPGGSTGVALITVDARGENSIVVVPGANGRLEPADAERARIDRGDVAVAQFEVPMATTAAALAHARAHGATTMLNAAPARPVSRELSDLVDVLVVNEIELNAIAQTGITRESSLDDLHSAVSRLGRDATHVTVVTLGSRGAVARIGDRLVEVVGRVVDVVDTTGAGDCFVGALAARLASGDGIEAALGFANIAASICVGRPGAGPSMPGIADVRERES